MIYICLCDHKRSGDSDILKQIVARVETNHSSSQFYLNTFNLILNNGTVLKKKKIILRGLSIMKQLFP